jgi:electron transport complex protein RnfD
MNDLYRDNGPHIKSNYNTTKMMRHLFIALLPIIIFSCYKNGFLPYYYKYCSLWEAFRPLLLILIGALTSVVSEVVYAYFILKRKESHLKEYIKYSYAIYPGLFLALIIPLGTPISVLIIGAIFATIVGKMLFGGFGYNIFNPALIGSLFITTAYYSVMMTHGGYLNPMEIDTISKATPLTNLQSLHYIASYKDVVASYGGNLWNFYVGFRPGSLGETSAMLCMFALIYLIATKVIKWRIPVIYISTVFVITAFIGFSNGLGIWYPLFQILTGGLMFGAVFMATDPVTSPTTPLGQVIYALSLGLLTVVFRFLTTYPEGVLTSILTLNMLIFAIDKIGAMARLDKKKVTISLLSLFLVIGLTTGYISNKVKVKEVKPEESFKVLNINRTANQAIYTVTQKGFHGSIKADVVFDKNGTIIAINVLEQTESVWTQVEDNNYINKLINHQKNLDEVDTIGGATYTSNYLKDLVSKVINYYNLKL